MSWQIPSVKYLTAMFDEIGRVLFNIIKIDYGPQIFRLKLQNLKLVCFMRSTTSL